MTGRVSRFGSFVRGVAAALCIAAAAAQGQVCGDLEDLGVLVGISEPSGVSGDGRAPARVQAGSEAAAEQAEPRATRVPDGLSASDWASIRAAYEAHRHEVVAVEDGFRARNPGQGWLTTFDRRGFEVRPDSGNWTWGLELAGYGWGGVAAVGEPIGLSATGGRFERRWDALLSEWCINDGGGLEHGFTVHERPVLAGGLLTLDVRVRGGLRPVVSGNGRDVGFVDAAGGLALNYNTLIVFDATGRRLEARWEARSQGQSGAVLRLTVDDADAVYPLTIDPIAQQAYLKASNTDAGDYFGWSVAISGDRLVVGAPFEDSAATGVNGNQADNSKTDSGAAYVFVRSGGAWTQEAYLKASNTDILDRFGSSVAISGDRVVVGAVGESSSATGVNGDQADNSAFGSGAAYVFARSGGAWTQEAYLKASNTGTGDVFGSSVAISGDRVVVGAVGESSAATGVNGNQADNSAFGSGAAYVFARSGGAWMQEAYLKASNTDMDDVFGHSVAISGDRVVVGAPFEDSAATGVNGNQADNSKTDSGAAYVFVRSGGAWTQEAYLKASNTDMDDVFGHSVAISGDRVVVGALREDSAATGVNGNQADNSATNSGAAYVFVRNGGAWTQEAYLKASNTGTGDGFGRSVAISGDRVVVGATGEDSASTGVNGDQADNSAPNSGAAYVFVRSDGSWTQEAYLKASNTDIGDWFGYSVAIDGCTIVVVALLESSAATGVNGNQADNSASASGAAYVFVVGDECLIDTDGDGIPDDWEINGIPYIDSKGVEQRLPLPGADPLRKDLYVEVDTMAGQTLEPGAITRLVAAFSVAPVQNPDGSTGITLHFIIDDETVPYVDEWQVISDDDAWPADFDTYRQDWFGTIDERFSPDAAAILEAKAKVYRYAIIAARHSPMTRNGSAYRTPGKAQGIPSDNFVIYQLNVLPTSGASAIDVNQAAIYMHELGHCLGLGHGGCDGVEGKTNQPSVMNYVYQYPYNWNSSFWTMDYLRVGPEELNTLNEASLDETRGIGQSTGHYRNVFMPFGVDECGTVPCTLERRHAYARLNGTPVDFGSVKPNIFVQDGIFSTSVVQDLNYIGTSVSGEIFLPHTPSPNQPFEVCNEWEVVAQNLKTVAARGTRGKVGPRPIEPSVADYQWIDDNLPPAPELCRADLNGDGLLDFFDAQLFLSLFAAGDLAADFTGDGVLDFFDAQVFLGLFAAGCP